MDKEIIRAISLRIKDAEGNALGSGFLFLPVGNYAYIFTAAHVIAHAKNDVIHIEFYHTDEVEYQENYYLNIEKDAFIAESTYRADGNGDFSPVDIAGVKIEKRDWMDQIPCFYLAEPLNDLPLFCVGYPRMTRDPEIEFAAHEAAAYVRHYNRNRIQLALCGPYDMADIVNQLEGMSGAGLMINAAGVCECLTGVWTCSQGAEAVGGIMNGITQNAIRNLCQQNNWPMPLTRIVRYQTVDGENVPTVDDNGETYEDLEIRQADYELTNVHDEYARDLEEIRTNLFELQVDSVLQKSESLLERLTTPEENRYEISRLHIYRANAYMLLLDSINARSELVDAESFSEQEKGLAYIMLANDSFAREDRIGARRYIEIAIESGGEHTQALLFEKFLSILEANNTTVELDIHELETVARAQPMTPKEWKQYFQLCANICVLKYQKRDMAIRYLNHSFSITADKSLLLTIAQNYQGMAYANPNAPDVVKADSAVRYYNAYLEYADALLQDQFYRAQGVVFIELLYLIQNYQQIKSCIDIVMGYADEAALSRLRFIKAHSLIVCGTYDTALLNQLDEPERTSLLLHQEFVRLSAAYGSYLDVKSGYEYDRFIGGLTDDKTEATLREDAATFEAEFNRITYKVIQFLNVGQNNTAPILAQLKIDVLNICLYLKRGAMFCTLLDECLEQYPGHDAFINLDRFRSEANHDMENAEENIVALLNRSFTYQNAKEAISFYLRNTKPEKILNIYRRALSNRDVGAFHRDQLVLGYLDFLSLPKTNDAELIQEYLQYKNELTEEQRQSIKGMLREKRGLEIPG